MAIWDDISNAMWKMMEFFIVWYMYWHPVTRQIWYRYHYKRSDEETKQLIAGRSYMQLIQEHGGGKWAKLDYYFAIPKAVALIALVIMFNLVYFMG